MRQIVKGNKPIVAKGERHVLIVALKVEQFMDEVDRLAANGYDMTHYSMHTDTVGRATWSCIMEPASQ